MGVDAAPLRPRPKSQTNSAPFLRPPAAISVLRHIDCHRTGRVVGSIPTGLAPAPMRSVRLRKCLKTESSAQASQGVEFGGTYERYGLSLQPNSPARRNASAAVQRQLLGGRGGGAA